MEALHDKQETSIETTKDKRDGKMTLDVSQKERRHGVAESGVLIRKTSIRRRISNKDMSEDNSYGNKNDEYEKICEKVMSETVVQKTIEALQEKWRMIMFMYEDCMELRRDKTERDKYAKRIKLKREFMAIIITYLLIIVPLIITLYLAFLFVIWFVTTAG